MKAFYRKNQKAGDNIVVKKDFTKKKNLYVQKNMKY